MLEGIQRRIEELLDLVDQEFKVRYNKVAECGDKQECLDYEQVISMFEKRRRLILRLRSLEKEIRESLEGE